MNIVETHDLTKIFHTGLKKGNVVAADSVSLNVRQGEVFGLLGPNGAGKTTLVKCLLALTSITSGEALVNGLPPADANSREKVGFLHENPRFPTHLTGFELLRAAGRLCGMKDNEIESRSSNLVKIVNMERWGRMKVKKYSKGMNERIGLAQALISDPDLIFLDEPTDGIDPIGKIEIREVLKRLRNEGKTVFLNSHLLAEVEQVADRVAILSNGQLMKVGTVEELTVQAHRYEIEANIGNERIQVSDEVGKVVLIAAKQMVVEVNEPVDINRIIDLLRMKQIDIFSVKPARSSLEKSFLDVVGQQREGEK